VLEAGDVEEAGAEFAKGEAEVVAPEELESDGGGALGGGSGLEGGVLCMVDGIDGTKWRMRYRGRGYTSLAGVL
jgi:hypothetical protein